MINLNTYNEMLKLLISYDNKLITQKEFEERKQELLELERSQRNEVDYDDNLVPAFSQEDFIRERRNLLIKRYFVLFFIMLILGSGTGMLYIRWRGNVLKPPIVTPDPPPVSSQTEPFSYRITDLAGLTLKELEQEFPDLAVLEDKHITFDNGDVNVFSLYTAQTEDEEATFTFYLFEDKVVRTEIEAKGKWLYSGAKGTAENYGILLTSSAWPYELNDETIIYQRVSEEIGEMAFYNISDEKSYTKAAFTFRQELFGPLAVNNPDFYWQGAKAIVKGALSRPDSAVFPSEHQNYRVVEYLGMILVESEVEYRNAKDQLTTSVFTVRFFPDKVDEANALIIDGEVLYDWS